MIKELERIAAKIALGLPLTAEEKRTVDHIKNSSLIATLLNKKNKK